MQPRRPAKSNGWWEKQRTLCQQCDLMIWKRVGFILQVTENGYLPSILHIKMDKLVFTIPTEPVFSSLILLAGTCTIYTISTTHRTRDVHYLQFHVVCTPYETSNNDILVFIIFFKFYTTYAIKALNTFF